MDNNVIYVAIPTYNGEGKIGTVDSVLRTALREGSQQQVYMRSRGSSLLADNFNTLWCEALNANFPFFAMLHADMVPEAQWLQTIFDLRAKFDCEIMSVLAPIKNNEGITSTAIGHPSNPWRVVKRITMREAMQLPPTFTAKDAGYPECPLLINTGCWIADLRKPWCRDLNSDGTAKFSFNIHSRIVRKNGKFCVETNRSEDWEMSRHVWEQGGKCLCTRVVKVHHYGGFGFCNDSPWGICQTDPYFDKSYRPNEEVPPVRPTLPADSNN